MRPLILNPEITQKIKDQAAWADRPNNWYYPEKDQQPPGDNPAYTMMLEVGYRVVYTQTVANGMRFRHMSISVDGDKYPNEVACWTIATMFGFPGGSQQDIMTVKPGKDWLMQVNQEEHCVVIAQKVE